MTDTADDALYKAKLRASLANESTNDALAAQNLNTPKRWTEAQEIDLVQKMHGTTEQRIQRLIEDANNGRI